MRGQIGTNTGWIYRCQKMFDANIGNLVSIWLRFGTSIEIAVSPCQIGANIGNLVSIWHQFGIENSIYQIDANTWNLVSDLAPIWHQFWDWNQQIPNRCQHLKFGVDLAPIWYQYFWIASEAVEAAQSKPVLLGARGVRFSKGGQNWPQICSTKLSLRDRGHFRGHTYYLIGIFAPNF